jgi:hypothetical protein
MYKIKIAYRSGIMFDYSGILGKDKILFPAVLFHEKELNFPKIMKPTFDILWQAFGLSGSQNYNELGEWLLQG